MNQNLQIRFAVELGELYKPGIAGKAVEKYLLDCENEMIKIPNAIYCVLQMLGDEYDSWDAMYVEYYGKCFNKDCEKCGEIKAGDKRSYQWCFWYVKQEYALNIAEKPIYSIAKQTDNNIKSVDHGENDIFLKLYAKLAFQCMAVYNTEYQCYLPKAFFRMVEYMLFLCSYRAFFAALKSAVKYDDAEMNYALRESLATALGLKDAKVDKKNENVENGIYSAISRMQGDEKAALARVVAQWGLEGDLQKGLVDMIHRFTDNLCKPEIRRWIAEHEEELKRVLGEELFYQVHEHCQKNVRL